MTGFDAYVGLNLAAFASGMTTPRDIPPRGEQTPPPPTGVGLNYMGGTATVSWTEPTLVGTPTDKFVRVWAKLGKGHKQIVASIAMPSPGTYSFTELRSGHSQDSPKIILVNESTNILLVQMDTIVARKAGQAPMIGPSSNVAQFKIVNP